MSGQTAAFKDAFGTYKALGELLLRLELTKKKTDVY